MPSSVMALCGQARKSERFIRMAGQSEVFRRRIIRCARAARLEGCSGFADAADRAVAELDRGAAEVDVEIRRELAEPRARQRRVLDHQRLEQLRILDALRDQ